MKKLILLFSFIVLSISGDCQSTQDTSDIVTIIYPNRDTLVIKDTPLGREFYKLWVNDPEYANTNPVIILTQDITPYLGIYTRYSKKKK